MGCCQQSKVASQVALNTVQSRPLKLSLEVQQEDFVAQEDKLVLPEGPIPLAGHTMAVSSTGRSPRVEVNHTEALNKVEVLVQSTLEDAERFLGDGDVFGAEAQLLAALRRLEHGDEATAAARRSAREALRRSGAYQEAVRLLRTFDATVCSVLGASVSEGDVSGWQHLADVPVNYEALDMVLSPEADRAIKPECRVIKLFYRRLEARLEIRVSAILPTRPTNASSSALSGWVAMNHETGLYDTWHPIVAPGGPRHLRPKGRHFNVWHLLLKIMWIRLCMLQEERMLFCSETGTYLFTVRDKPPSDPRWEEHPAPAGFKVDPNALSAVSVVVVPQAVTTFFAAFVEVDLAVQPPEMILSWVLKWVLPEIVRRLLKSGAAALRSDGPHFDKIQQDAEGLYAETEDFVRLAEALDTRRGHCDVLSPVQPPTAEALLARQRSLLLDAEQAEA